MNADRLADNLQSVLLGRRLECHEKLTSTNDRARELLDLFGPAAHGAVVTADLQTAGRGRLGRLWHGTAGRSLAMSVALWPPAAAVGLTCVPLAAALAVRASLARCGVEALLKWPNDLLVGGRKIAGVLLEGRFGGDGHKGLALGIGVNLGQASAEFPPELAGSAVSVREITGEAPDPERFAADTLLHLEPLLKLSLANPPALVALARDAWAHPVGTPLAVTAGSEVIEGRFDGVGSEGELRLRTGTGLRVVRQGDVEQVRPGGAP